jgi:hypothetical protein
MVRLTAVALLSAAALAFEVLLVRAFSIMQWYHFAAMIISMALLGYGASGTLLTFARSWLLARIEPAFAVLAALFGIGILAGASLAQAVPLNLLELAWDRSQQANMLLLYVLLATPFLFAGTAIGLALAGGGAAVGRVYRSDLLGAGCGSLGVVALLSLLPVASCLEAIAGAALLGAAVASGAPRRRRALGASCLAGAVLLPLTWPQAWLTPRPSPYKELSLALTVPDARVVAERHGPLGQLTVVASPTVPFRWAPGESLLAEDEPPEQLAVFTDGSGMSAITRFDGDLQRLRYLDGQTAALPFHVRAYPRVLVLGAGGGADVLLARLFAARSIDAVELNPQMVELVRGEFAAFAGDLYRATTVHVHVADARAFVNASGDLYDIMQISLLDSFAAAAGGLLGLGESTLYTVEAFRALLDRLAPDGLLAMTRWVSVPPRDPLKVFATAVEALRDRGIDDPGGRLAWIRGWRTTTLLIKNGAFTADEIAAIRTFSRDRAFDLAWLPGIRADEANRYNVLEQPWFYEGAAALLGPDAHAFLENYKFDVAPATDDRPYFFHTLKTATLLELLRMPERAGFNLVEWGYPVLLATLAQAIIAGVVLILLPLSALRRPPGQPRAGLRTRVVLYFAALGLAFLFVEITFIQRFQLFLGHPVYAVSAVLCAFLVFAGLGSGAARVFADRLRSERRAAAVAIVGIAALALVELAMLGRMFTMLVTLPLTAKLAVSVMAIAPLAFCMGMPFPLGLARLQTDDPRLMPWAWGINGCASVISAVLASLLALQLGFSRVLLAAVALYALAALAFPATAHSRAPLAIADGRQAMRAASTHGRSGRIRTGDP